MITCSKDFKMSIKYPGMAIITCYLPLKMLARIFGKDSVVCFMLCLVIGPEPSERSSCIQSRAITYLLFYVMSNEISCCWILVLIKTKSLHESRD